MKTFTSLLIGCALALAGAVIAQQPETQESPTKKGAAKEKPAAAEATPRGKAAAAEKRAAPTASGVQQPPGGRAERVGKGHKAEATAKGATIPGAEATAGAMPTGKQADLGKKGKKGREEKATRAPASATPVTGAATNATPATGTTPATGATTQGNIDRGSKRVEAQQVQQIKQQHMSFRAQPKPQQVPGVTYNDNYRIQGSEQWSGPQYEVFRSYHPEWHDQGWYRSRYTRVELIGGGWYFWNNGFWFPAWGYDPGVAYYPYDGPIYVGHRAEPPDQVIADVQAELKEIGYYQGEVDGLLGPLTRHALRDYQADHGLAVTEAIDEPTLDSLQLS